MDVINQAAEQSQYLTFQVGDDEYAIGVLHVREIIGHSAITRVPGTADHVLGVINLRGSVVPVVDLGRKFGAGSGTLGKRTCIVIAEVDVGGEQAVMGILADSVSQVIELGPAAIEPPPPFGTPVAVEYLRGLGKTDGRFVLILDVDRALATEVAGAPTGRGGDAEASAEDAGSEDGQPRERPRGPDPRPAEAPVPGGGPIDGETLRGRGESAAQTGGAA